MIFPVFTNMDLVSLYWNMKGPARQKSMAFLRAYEKSFSHLRGLDIVIYEIGCGYPQARQAPGSMGMGGSLLLWSQFFGERCKVVGIDIIPECVEYESLAPNIKIEIGSQEDSSFLSNVLKKHGAPTIVIDDGSHKEEHVKATFDFLYPHVMINGFYAVEDMADSHLQDGYSWDDNNRFMNRAASAHVLEINQAYTGRRIMNSQGKDIKFPATALGFTTQSIAFYPNLVIYSKGENVPFDQLPGPPHYILSL